MATRYATATRNAKADAVGALMSGGTVEIYTGSQPASANDAASGTLLATVTLGTSPSASAGVVTMPDPASVNAVATGTAGWFRVLSSGAATVWDGAIGVEGTLSSTSLVSGNPVDLSAVTYTQPSGE
jgi:hypothetical protein